jgi:heat shock protein HtpX
LVLGRVCVVLIAVAVGAGAGSVSVFASAAVFFAIRLVVTDRIAPAAMGAKEVTVADAPDSIERLCVQTSTRSRASLVVTAPIPNTFALGGPQNIATVCATTGLLSQVGLGGVLAHELTHVINRPGELEERIRAPLTPPEMTPGGLQRDRRTRCLEQRDVSRH